MALQLASSNRPSIRLSRTAGVAVGLPLMCMFAWGALHGAVQPAAAGPSPQEAASGNAAVPTPVAVVNLRKVLENAEQASQWQMQVMALTSAAKDETKRREDDLNRKKGEAEKLLDPAARELASQQLALDALRFEEWLQVRKGEVERELALMVQSLMRLLRAEAKRLAQEMGYKLILLDDSGSQIEPDSRVNMPRQVQVLNQAMNLRVLFADESIDITDQIIVRLNNAATAQPTAGASGAAPSKAPATSVTGATTGAGSTSR